MDDYLIDGTKLTFHPERVLQWQQATTWELASKLYPLYVEIAPIGACNHRCTFCSVDYIGYKSVEQDKVKLMAALLEMKQLGVKSVMFAGEGEPLLYKPIDEVVEWCRMIGMDCSFTTNGTILQRLTNLPACSWVKVSINAGRKETYAKIHRTRERHWDVVWRNIVDAAKRKGNCTLGIQSVMLPENRDEMVDLAKKARDSGADYLVIKPYTQSRSGDSRIYEGLTYDGSTEGFRGYTQLLDHELQKLNTDTFKVVSRTESMMQAAHPPKYDKCHATPNFWAYIMASGDVYTCGAYLLDKNFWIGNINKSTFKQIWESEDRHKNWDFVHNELDISDCRINCRMDKANRYLDGFEKQKHINFI